MVVPLVEKNSLSQQTDISLAEQSVQSVFKHMFSLSELPDSQTNKLQTWLSQVGLDLNPFGYIDAGEDPLIPFYLVDHNQFDKVHDDQVLIVTS